jgi:arylsulfatase A-like enzyme/Tfp pilus assembly protein PilF
MKTLRARTLTPTGLGCLAASLLLVLAGCGREHRNLNVLLVSLDTVRPDHLGCYGYTELETPHIDRLAGESIVFHDALTSVPLTLPSHASILTGLYPISHGVRLNGTFTLTEEYTTLAEVLKAEGYETGAFIGAFVLDARFGTAQGFDTYDDRVEQRAVKSAMEHDERSAAAVTASVSEWLEGVSEPFFAFVHYYDPHNPYEPPAPYDSLYAANLYDGEIAYTDGEVGRLLDLLRDRGLLERTLVVLVSDHGESLGEHDELYHGVLIYEAAMEVALMIRPPESLDLGTDLQLPLRIDRVVELIDVFPTILDLLDIDLDHEIDGRSLVPLIEDRPFPPKVCYLESLYPHLAYKWSQLTGVRFNDWKFIFAPEEELYNLREDPHETRNLRAIYPDRAIELKANLLNIVNTRSRTAPQSTRTLSEEEAEKLRALGYVNPSYSTIPTDIEPKGANPRDRIGNLEALLYRGIEAKGKGDLETAIALLTRLTEVDPGNPAGHAELAEALFDVGDVAGAQAEYLKVVEIDSTNTQGFLRLGDAARVRGDLDQALLFYRVAAEILPETPTVLSNIGSILMEQGHTDSAMVILRQALQIDSDDQIALVNIALGYLAQDRQDEALLWFHKTLKANPKHVKALMNIAFILLKRNQPDSLITYLERARDAAPMDVGVLKNLGSAYRQQGMVAEAATTFEVAVRIAPDDVTALFGLAATRAQQGRKQESIQLLERILRIDPNFTPAKHALAGLASGS